MKHLTIIIVGALAAVCSSASVLPLKPFVAADGSCVARCGDNDSSLSCQCNTECVNFNDCCPDYDTVCYTCQDRCGEVYNYACPCVCSDGCEGFGDCCLDYADICEGGGTGGSVTAQDILNFTEKIFIIGQPDFVGTYIVYDSQPPGPLFISVDSAAFASDTMQTYLTLRSFYEPDPCIAEDLSTDYETAKDAFLDAVMATEIMAATDNFLKQFGMLTGSLRDYLDLVFFFQYIRCSPSEGSSGFEHCFCGEIDNNQVKGLNNWISFYLDELVGQIDYTTYIGQQTISSPELDLFMMGFEWQGSPMTTSSMWIGSTPEMELSLYAVCFLYKPDTLVDVSMNGIQYKIQTYQQMYNNNTLIGSVYPNFL